MNRKHEFIKKFHLVKNKKISVQNGRQWHERVLYTDNAGNNFCFFNNDLCTVRIVNESLNLWILTSAYSWYH